MRDNSGHATNHATWLNLLTAVLLVGFTALLRWPLGDVLGDRAACLIFFPAVALSAYLGGMWAGLLATLLSAVVADATVMKWHRGAGEISGSEIVQTGIFITTGAFISILTHALHRSERARARGEERYRTFIHQSSEGIWRFELEQAVDPGWPQDRQIDAFFAHAVLAECNDAMARMYGYDRADQLVGARLGQLLLKDDPANVEYLRQFIRSGYRLSDAESHERAKDGAEKYFLNNLIGVVEGGMLVRAWGSQRDVTEQRRAQQHLSLYREIFAHSNDGIGIIDTSGKYIEQNAAHRALTGYSDAEIEGKTPAMHLGQEMFEQIARELSSGGAWRGEAISHVKSGARVPVELSAFAVRDPSGAPLCYVGIKRDMTARRRADARLTAEHAVTRILADAESLEDAAPAILGAIREALHAQVGQLWLPDDAAGVLRCAAGSAAPDDPHGDAFGQRSRKFTFARGVGLPGRVWKDGKAAWIVDVVRDPNFPRARFAEEARLHSGFAFPIANGGEFFGVIEFLSCQVMEPDPALLNMMSAIGSEIGQFVLRRRAEQQLRDSQRDLADFVENATVGLHWVGPDGTILWANQAELDMLGYARDEYIGRKISEFHADPSAMAQIMDCLSQGKTLTNFATRLRRKDGTIRHVLIDSNVMWRDGKFVHTRCFTRDVTDQVLAEQALRDSAESLRLALEAGRMGTWEWEIGNGRVTWSPGLEAIHGMAPGSFAGTFQAFLADVHPDDRELVTRQIQATLALRKDHHIEYRLKRRDGTERWVEGRGKLYCDELGTPQRMVGVCTDVTERKRHEQERNELLRREQQARAEAERANRAKDEFLAVLSHELRTPLTPVLLTAELLESTPGLPPEVRQDIQTIRHNVELEARLIDDLLDLTRIARGKLQLDLQVTDVHALVQNAIDICHQTDAIQLVVDLAAQRHHVRADPARLQQVFWNLLNNAHKFTPPGGTITVRSRNTADGRVRVEVIDTGVGIDPQLLPRIFAAFEQGHGDSRRFGGLGLGLAISRALVVAQGGTLSAHSDGPGTGAMFTVEMAAVRVTAPRAELPADGDGDGRAVGAGGSRSLRILVVEDHEPTRYVMTRLLTNMGHTPLSASGIETAMRAVRENHVDLVISDLGLPDGSGHELMRQIRALYDVRGIALSGYGMEEDLRRSVEAGFAEHLTKPIDLSRLEAAIRRVCEQPAIA
jgi:PAS domain S-box-containing protein